MRFLTILTCLLFISLTSVFAQEIEKNNIEENLIVVKGKATYYAHKFVGRKTSNGQIYTHKKFTAAHKTLPFGTIVTVYNPKNDKSVTVVINDRGPFNKHLMIDLSQSAAKEIGILGMGIAPVEMSYTLPNAPEKLVSSK
jgi:rare lipoprotein A